MQFNTLGIVWDNLTSPRRKMPTAPWNGGQEHLHIPYAAASPSQYLDLYLPDVPGKKPLLVLVHGGGFLLGDSQTRQAQWMYRYFRQKGYVCASVNYRLAQEAPYPAAVADVQAAIAFLRANADAYGIDKRRIALWGESAGGYLAAMAAVSADVQVLIDYYSPAELGDKTAEFRQEGIPAWVFRLANSWLNTPILKASGFTQVDDYFIRRPCSTLSPEEAAAYSPLRDTEAMAVKGLKVILVHGDADITVPVLQTRKKEAAYIECLGQENVFALYPPRCKHADDRLYSDEFLAVIKQKLDGFIGSPV